MNFSPLLRKFTRLATRPFLPSSLHSSAVVCHSISFSSSQFSSCFSRFSTSSSSPPSPPGSSSSDSSSRSFDLHFLTLPDVELTNAKLLKWLVTAGAQVNAGDNLAEIDSDLAVIEYKAQQNGFLASVYLSPGDSIEADEIMGILVNQPHEVTLVQQEIILNKDKKSIQHVGKSHSEGPKSHQEHKSLAEKIGAL
jgi:hypothetical protein